MVLDLNLYFFHIVEFCIRTLYYSSNLGPSNFLTNGYNQGLKAIFAIFSLLKVQTPTPPPPSPPPPLPPPPPPKLPATPPLTQKAYTTSKPTLPNSHYVSPATYLPPSYYLSQPTFASLTCPRHLTHMSH